MSKAGWIFAAWIGVALLVVLVIVDGSDEEAKERKAVTQLKKDMNALGLLKVVRVPWCISPKHWTYPLKAAGRTISFHLPSKTIRAEVSGGEWWYPLQVSDTGRTYVHNRDAVKFCLLKRIAPDDRSGGSVDIEWH